MIVDPEREDTVAAPPRTAPTGCSDGLVLFLVAGGVLTLILAGNALAFVVDEISFEGMLQVPTFIRPLIIAGFEIPPLLVLLLLGSRWKTPIYRAIYRTWAVALVFSLLLSPARALKITAGQEAVFSQILLMGIFGVILVSVRQKWWFEGDTRLGLRGSKGGAVALFFAAILSYPWLAWGALGSPFDTLLALLAGALFGLEAAWVLGNTLFSPAVSLARKPGERFGLIGFAAVVTLLLMATGLAYTGFHWYLFLAIPPLGFALYRLALLSRDGDRPGNGLPVAILAGVGAAAPLMLVDPDELSLVISSGPGELLQWVVRAGMVALAAALATGIILIIVWRQARLNRAIWRIGAGAAWLAGLILYFVVGQPGFFGEQLFVIFKNQADVSAAAAMKDYNQRRVYVYQTLVSQAEQSQSPVRESLRRFGIAYRPFYLVNGMEVTGSPLLRMWLQTRPEVDRVLDNPILRPLPEKVPVSQGNQPAPQSPLWNQTLIGADRVWKEFGATGQGIVVGQSDSGVQGDHPELSASYRGKDAGSDFNWLDPWNGSKTPADIGGHGTHTLGTIVGTHTGIAPGAAWFGCVNLARNLGNPATYLDCMEFMLAPYPQGGDPFHDGDPTRSANVMNDSWGCPDVEGCDPESLRPAVDALKAAGIFVVASAGNSGLAGCATVTDPIAIYPSAYSVGAVNASGQLAVFSSLGPVEVDGSRRIKPDIAAPGEDVLSAFPGNTYQTESGTSMAGPHVVGVVALMWSANPALIGDIDRTMAILNDTAQPYRGSFPGCVDGEQTPNDAVGYGIVDAYAAVKMALAAK